MLKTDWDKIPAGSQVSFPDTEIAGIDIVVGNKFAILAQSDTTVSKKNSHRNQEEQVCFTAQWKKSYLIANVVRF